ncbi:hypothetical protein T484DRAFT_1817398, partial [Baffinella frigidus]
ERPDTERPDTVPYISELLHCNENLFTAPEVSSAEIKLLQVMGWRACAVTYLSFLAVHLNQSTSAR